MANVSQYEVAPRKWHAYFHSKTWAKSRWVTVILVSLLHLSVVMSGPAFADRNYPSGCDTWATEWSWDTNCWLGNNYDEDGNYTGGIQGQLQALGYYGGSIDGLWGPLTEGAVKNYQSARGLSSDGIVGNNTWDAFYDDKFYSHTSGDYWVYDTVSNSSCRDCFWLNNDSSSAYYLHWYILDFVDPDVEYLTAFTVYGPQ